MSLEIHLTAFLWQIGSLSGISFPTDFMGTFLHLNYMGVRGFCPSKISLDFICIFIPNILISKPPFSFAWDLKRLNDRVKKNRKKLVIFMPSLHHYFSTNWMNSTSLLSHLPDLNIIPFQHVSYMS